MTTPRFFQALDACPDTGELVYDRRTPCPSCGRPVTYDWDHADETGDTPAYWCSPRRSDPAVVEHRSGHRRPDRPLPARVQGHKPQTP